MGNVTLVTTLSLTYTLSVGCPGCHLFAHLDHRLPGGQAWSSTYLVGVTVATGHSRARTDGSGERLASPGGVAWADWRGPAPLARPSGLPAYQPPH